MGYGQGMSPEEQAQAPEPTAEEQWVMAMRVQATFTPSRWPNCTVCNKPVAYARAYDELVGAIHVKRVEIRCHGQTVTLEAPV